MTLGIFILEEVADGIALAERIVHPGVGVTGAKGKSGMEPECEPKELGGEGLLIFGEGLKDQQKKNTTKTPHITNP